MTPILRPSDPSTAGFTLMEMLIVLTIFSLVAVLIAPRMSWRPGAVSRGELVVQIESALRAAALEAARTSKPQTLDLRGVSATAQARVPEGFNGVGAIIVYPDGSTNGASIELDGRPLLNIDWLTGDTQRAR